LLVLTGVDSNRLANGSSGRSETEMSFFNSSSPSALVVVSSRDRSPYACQPPNGVGTPLRLPLLTLLNLTGPPSEIIPLSRFFTMQGCSTAEMAREGTGSQGASWVLSRGALGVYSLSMVADIGRMYA
jgi:hypothetical protein